MKIALILCHLGLAYEVNKCYFSTAENNVCLNNTIGTSMALIMSFLFLSTTVALIVVVLTKRSWGDLLNTILVALTLLFTSPWIFYMLTHFFGYFTAAIS